jgi:hypothetical protein
VERLNGTAPIEALDIEYQLGRLLRRLRRKALYPQHASYIAKHFDREQMRVLYHLLDEIEDRIPRDGLEFWRAARLISDHRRSIEGGAISTPRR